MATATWRAAARLWATLRWAGRVRSPLVSSSARQLVAQAVGLCVHLQRDARHPAGRSLSGIDCIAGLDALNGSSDAQVLERDFVEDRMVVTLNVVDFVRLARAREVHAGLTVAGGACHVSAALVANAR
jgi:hypothetical protein